MLVIQGQNELVAAVVNVFRARAEMYDPCFDLSTKFWLPLWFIMSGTPCSSAVS